MSWRGCIGAKTGKVNQSDVGLGQLIAQANQGPERPLITSTRRYFCPYVNDGGVNGTRDFDW